MIVVIGSSEIHDAIKEYVERKQGFNVQSIQIEGDQHRQFHPDEVVPLVVRRAVITLGQRIAT
jgi:hypothetical protein